MHLDAEACMTAATGQKTGWKPKRKWMFVNINKKQAEMPLAFCL